MLSANRYLARSCTNSKVTLSTIAKAYLPMDDANKAKDIISKIAYITIASVSKDGKPWNTPVYSAFDEHYHFFLVSWKGNQHSTNIVGNPNVFIVIYDSTVPEGTGKAVYIKAKAYELSDEAEIEHALAILYTRSGKDPHKTHSEEFLGSFPRRAYKAVPEKFWMNSHGAVNGNYVDTRMEIQFVNIINA